ncbi:MAG: guanylate kinase [Gammaproteobacteria bacterium]|nr:guanylate kinase [Gammaproteobacteria bacterium]
MNEAPPQSTRASGHLFVVSAPSGAGKTSLVRALVAARDGLRVSISHTTRARRDGEVDGVDYHFIEPDRFARMADAGEFLEHATVFDHSYGTSRAAVATLLDAGHDVMLEIDWQGARSIRAAAPDAISIFVLPPSLATLEARLRGRGDAAAVIARRMRDAQREISHYPEYDYLVVNDDFDQALAALAAILDATAQRREVQSLRHAALLAELVAR